MCDFTSFVKQENQQYGNKNKLYSKDKNDRNLTLEEMINIIKKQREEQK